MKHKGGAVDERRAGWEVDEELTFGQEKSEIPTGQPGGGVEPWLDVQV